MIFFSILLAGLILLVMAVMLFNHSAVAFLQARDEAIRSRPPPDYFRDSWLVENFYPPTRKNRLARADRFLVWVVVLAVLTVIYEIGSLVGIFPEDEYMINKLTVIFLIIFGFEFVLRFLMKGASYMAPWGAIDLTVILIDLLIIAIHYGWLASIGSSLGFEGEAPAAAALLRLLRVARLFRAMKIIRYAFDKQRRALFWRSIRPHIKALTRLTLIVLLIAAVFGSVISMMRDMSPFEGWAQIISQVLKSLGSSSGSDPFALAASVLILAALANMVAIFYAPIMGKIREEQSRNDNLDLMEGHVIIVLNDREEFGGFVEELLHVFRNPADKEVFLLHEGGDSLGFENGPRLTVIDDPIADPATWRSCAAQNAEIIILLGKHDVLVDQDYLNFLRPGGDTLEAEALIIEVHNDRIEIGRDKQSYERLKLFGGVDKVRVHLRNLIVKIEKNAWSRRSLQFAYLHKLTDEFEESLEFPDLSQFSGSEDAAARIADRIIEHTGIEIRRRGHNLLIDLTKQQSDDLTTPAELSEIRLLEAIVSILRANPGDATLTCVFAYVAAFELVARNAKPNETQKAHLSVFAVEFAAALALFHESIAPGVLKGWLTDWKLTEQGVVILDTELQRIETRQRLLSPTALKKSLDLQSDETVLAIATDEGKLSVVTRGRNRFEKNRASHAITRQNGGAIDSSLIEDRSATPEGSASASGADNIV